MSYAFMRFPGDRELALTFSYDDGFEYDKKLVEMFTYTKTYEEAIKWQNFVVAEDAE